MDSLFKKEELKNFSFVLPALLIFSFFYVIPLFYTFWLALHRGSGIDSLKWAGFDNFRYMFLYDKKWWQALGRSFYIAFWALTFQNILAFSLALAVDRAVRTGNIYRVIFFLLPILSEIIFGNLIRQLLIPEPGVFNHFLESIGLGRFVREWLNDPNLALTTLAFTHCWRGFGWGFVIFLAGLQTIPSQLYEAARVDGANAFQRFFKITLPLMIPVIFLVIILTILGTVMIIGLPMALTRGGPADRTVVSVLKIFNDLKNYHAGYASSEGIVLGIILVAVSFTLIRISRKLSKV